MEITGIRGGWFLLFCTHCLKLAKASAEELQGQAPKGAKRRLDAVRLSSPRVTSRSASVARLFPLLGPSVLVFTCQVASVKLALCMKSSICIAKKSNVRLGWLLQNMHLLSRLPLSFKHQKRPSFNTFNVSQKT